MFAQVGLDAEATQHLQRMDNMATDRDIVDTFQSNLSHVQQWSAQDWNFKVVKLLLGAIDKNTDLMQSRPPPPATQPMALWPQSAVASGSNAQRPGYGYGGTQTTPQGSPPAYSSTSNTKLFNNWGKKS